jgi:hypothetical protein
MKRFKFLSILLATIILIFLNGCCTGCEPDDDPNNGNFITAKTIFENLVIDGAAIRNGVTESPNFGIQFNFNKASAIAIPEIGSTIGILTDSEVTGAFVQIEDEGGNLFDSYYDVDLSENSSKSKIHTTNKAASDYQIRISFDNSLMEGNFCYIISLYDDLGNISQDQQLCVSITPTANEPAFFGEWFLTGQYERIGTEEFTTLPGVEECEGDQPEDLCFTLQGQTLRLNGDGTFSISSLDVERQNNESEAEADQLIGIISGQWAWDQFGERLMLYENKFEVFDNGIFDANDSFEIPIKDAFLIEMERTLLDVNDNVLSLIYDESAEESFVEVYEKTN